MATSRRRGPIDVEAVRSMVADLPGVEEATSYGTPALKVRGRLFARFHQDGESLVVRVEDDERAALLAAEPTSFFVTDHYRDHPWILVRLDRAERPLLAGVLRHAWRLRAPASLVKRHEAAGEEAG